MPIQARRRWPSALVIVTASLFPALGAAEDVRIRARVANVRAEGSSQGKVLFQVKAGDVLRLLDVAGDWLHVETADGRRGYVSKTLAECPSAPPARPAPRRPHRPRPPSAGALAIDHKEVGCIVGDRYPRLDACFQPPASWATRRSSSAPATGPWYAVDLMADGACHVAYLPKPLATTTAIEYYVAAVDKSFNERQQPETAPEAAYHARVVRNQGDCDRLKAVAASVKKVAKPIVVAAARTKGAPPRPSARSSSASARRAWSWPVRRRPAREQERQEAAAAGAAAGGSGGGIGTGTLAIAGGAVAAGVLVAVGRGRRRRGGGLQHARHRRPVAGHSRRPRRPELSASRRSSSAAAA